MPTVSRALIEESDAEQAEQVEVVPSDFVPASRESWEDLDHLPMPGDSDLPLPMTTHVDGDDGQPFAPRMPRNSLDLGSDSMVPLPLPDSEIPAAPSAPQAGPSARAPDEHPLWTQARSYLASENHGAAADVLERLCTEQTGHEKARTALVQLSLMLGRHDRVGVHTAWLLKGQLDAHRGAEVCQTYQRVRSAAPSLVLPEVALLAALSAADAIGAGPVVLDATNMLLKHHAASPHGPRSLLIVAKHQFMAGANDSAVQTLRYLVATFPRDIAAEPARRKLAELDRA